MSRLILVRHGQASAFTDDYDRLSRLGHQQSALLGDMLVRRDIEISSVYSGPLKRQRGTAAAVAERFQENGAQFPDPVIVEDLKEIDADLIMSHIMQVRKDYPDLDRLICSYEEAVTREAKGDIFQEFFERVMLLWMTDQLKAPGAESLAELKFRVVRALETILENHGTAGNIIVFSSASPVAIMSGHLMGLRDRQMLEITFGMNNCSATEFALTSRGPVLRRFNCTGHLSPEMVTLR